MTIDKTLKLKKMKELSVVQKTYDLVKYYVPIIERFPKIHKFIVGDIMTNNLTFPPRRGWG